ncbi:tetratricopeptide repeat protein [candidate division KSB1 bacterium]
MVFPGQNGRKIIIIAVFGMLLNMTAGCAYYNVYYNAKKAYNDGLKAIEQSNAQKPTPQAISHFNNAIEKSSKILALYPGNRWNDDALLLIGKSYYHMEQYANASVSLQDLIDNFPNSNLLAEARLYNANTLLRQDKFNLAESELKKVVSSDADEKIKNETYIILADLFYYRGEYEQAIQNYSSLLSETEDNTVRQQAQLKIAESYRALEDNENAAAGFLKVLEYDPPESIVYLSQFGYGISLQNLGRYDDAILIFRQLLDKKQFIDFHNELFIEIARCYELMGNIAKSIDVLEKLNELDINNLERKDNLSRILDEEPQKSQEETKNETAEAQEGKAAPGVPRINPALAGFTGTQQASGNPDALFYIAELNLLNYKNLAAAKQYYRDALSSRPTPELRNSINDKIALINELELIYKTYNLQEPTKPVFQGETAAAQDSATAGKAELLKKTPPEKLQQSAVGNPPAKQEKPQPQQSVSVNEDSLKFRQELERYHTELREYYDNKADAFYRLAEINMLEFGNLDTTLTLLNRIIEELPESKKAPQSLFMLYNIAQSYDIGEPEHFKESLISKYPDSEHAWMLTKPADLDINYEEKIQMEEEVTVDSAQVLFDRAEDMYYIEKEDIESIEQYLAVVERFPQSEYAPKSLYAIGWILENTLHNNSAAFKTYERLQKEYPGSSYARTISTKMTEVKSFRDKQAELKELEEKRQQILNSGPPVQDVSVSDSTITDIVVKDTTRTTLILPEKTQIAEQVESLVAADSISSEEIKPDSSVTFYDPDEIVGVTISDELLRRIINDTTHLEVQDSISNTMLDSTVLIVADSMRLTEQDSLLILMADSSKTAKQDTIKH